MFFMNGRTLVFHGFGSIPMSELNQALIKNIEISNNLVTTPVLPGHKPNKTHNLDINYFKHNGLLEMLNNGYQLIDKFIFENKNESQLNFIGNSVGAYFLMNWLHKNSENPFENIVLFKPMFDLEHSLTIQDKSLEELGIKSLKKLLKFDEYKNKLVGSINNKYQTSANMLIFAGENDDVVGNENFMKQRLDNINASYITLREAEHFTLKEEELIVFKNEVNQYLLKKYKNAS